jgi:CRISPR-associated Csx2 family protein
MNHTLVTFLGKERDGSWNGYRETTYQFPNGVRRTHSFFGLALAEHLQPDRVVILGTRASMWGVLVEHVAAGGEEAARIALIDAEAAGQVDQLLLDRVAPVMQRAAWPEIVPRLIPLGRTGGEQHGILETVSQLVASGNVSFDVTHGFRHMGMVGMLSAFMLERTGRLRVHSLWYGALDMTTNDITPVLRLDGLHAIQRWISALDRFDASGDYGIFASLLEADGVAQDKVRCLEEAAFYERILNLSDAAQKLRTFLKAIDEPLPGASRLFQDQLKERLRWVRGPDLAAQQRQLADQYLGRGDYVRAAVFAWEALVSGACAGFEWQRRETREAAAKAIDEKFSAPDCDALCADAFQTIRRLRNALAHGNPPTDDRFRKMLASPEALHGALRRAIDRLLPGPQACGADR